MHLKSLITALYLLTITVSMAQEFHQGSILINGETREGYLYYNPRNNSNKGVIKFKATLTDKPVTFTAQEVTGFTLTELKASFISVPSTATKETVIFAEVLRDGRAILASNSKHYFIKIDEQILQTRIPLQVKSPTGYSEVVNKKLVEVKEMGRLKNILTGCDSLEFKTLTQSSIISLIDQYNKCTGVPSKELKRKKISIGITAGANVSMLYFKSVNPKAVNSGNDYSLDQSTFDPSIGFEIGTSITFLPLSFLDKTTLQLGISVASNRYQAIDQFELESLMITQKNEITFDVASLKFPLIVRKYFLTGQQGFHYGLAFTPYTIVNYKSQHHFREFQDNILTEQRDVSDFIPKKTFSVAIGGLVGYAKSVSDNHAVRLSLQVDYDWGFAQPTYGFLAHLINTHLQVSYQF